jgi:hypothetical protein
VKFKHNTLIFLAGAVWLMIGIFLLSMGIHFVLETLRNPLLSQIPGKFSLTSYLGGYFADKTHAMICMITIALLVGYFKGKMVLAKSVNRQIKRIETLPKPASLKHLYSKGYYLLIALMICLGMSMKFLPITLDTRGAIDIAIGSALINGAMLYFRSLAQKTYLKRRSEKGNSEP